MSDLSTIKNAIIDGRFTEDELLELNHLIVDELKEARSRASRRAIQALKPGTKAKVTGRLRGDALLGEVGEVVKVNRTRVEMRFDNRPGITTVPANVLEPCHD